jgi:acyl carrier protein
MPRNPGAPPVREWVRAYLADSFLTPIGLPPPQDDDDLLAVLDSLQLLRMVIDLEEAHGIKVLESELSPDNLGSVARIVRFVSHKTGGSHAG